MLAKKIIAYLFTIPFLFGVLLYYQLLYFSKKYFWSRPRYLKISLTLKYGRLAQNYKSILTAINKIELFTAKNQVRKTVNLIRIVKINIT
jgi:hypothetical protein